MLDSLKVNGYTAKVLENDLGMFSTLSLYDSAEFLIKEHRFRYKRDHTQKFRTNQVKYIEMSFFIHPHYIEDSINGQKTIYKPFSSYIYLTPDNADVEIFFREKLEYRHVDVYLDRSYFDGWSEVNTDIQDFLRKKDGIDSAHVFPGGVPICERVVQILYAIKSCRLKGLSREYFMKGKVFELLSVIFEKGKRLEDENRFSRFHLRQDDKAKIEQIARTIEENLDRFFTIADLAQRFGLNTFKLKKGFKEIYGIGVFEFTIQQKIAKAKELIRETDLSFKEVAFMLGYSAASSFSTRFKMESGQSPAAYKKSLVDSDHGSLVCTENRKEGCVALK